MSTAGSSGENPISDKDVIAYIVGSLDEQRSKIVEKRAADDLELAAEIAVLRTLVEATMEEDTQTIAKFAHALGVPLDDFVPDEYEIVAGATFNLLKGAVSEQEAKAYAVYRKEADQLGAHETQCDHLDPCALHAVVQAGVYTDAQQAEAAVLKVVNALSPVLKEIQDSHRDEMPPSS